MLTSLVLEVFRLNGLLLATGDRLTAGLGLSSALWQVLGAIDHQPLSMAQIGRNMGLARQSVRRTAHILERKGLVEFVENPDHKRAMLTRLTPLGRETLDQVNRIRVEWANCVARNISVEELRDAGKILRELAAGLSRPEDGE